MSLPYLDSDDDLRRRVSQYLFERHRPGLRQLSVEADAGTVTLRGKVGSFYEKQLCQNICRRVAGVRQVVDQVSVTETPTRRPAFA
jgi:osmotically-inducible protein OsmY